MRHLRCFLAVAEELNFRRAAERLNMSQPPVTVAIQQLESELGFSLFARTKRQVRLSPAGVAFRMTAREMMEKLEAGVHLARRIGRGEVDVIKVGFLVPAAWGILPLALRRFREKFPAIEIRLEPQDFKIQLEEIARRSCDLYLGAYLPSTPVLATRRLQSTRLAAMIPPGHPMAGEGSLSIRDFANETILLPLATYSPALREDVVKFCMEKGKFKPRLIENLDPPSLAIFALSGLGIAFFPEHFKALILSEFTVRPFKEPGPKVQTGLVWPREKEGPALRALIAEIVASAALVEKR